MVLNFLREWEKAKQNLVFLCFWHLLGDEVSDKQQNRNKTKNLCYFVLICFFVLTCFLYGAWFSRKWKRTKENLVFQCFWHLWGIMLQINNRTETKQKTFSKNPPFFWGVSFFFLFLSFFIVSFRCCPFFFVFLLFLQTKRHRKQNNQKNKKGTTTQKKK